VEKKRLHGRRAKAIRTRRTPNPSPTRNILACSSTIYSAVPIFLHPSSPIALFVRLISHQPTVLFSQNKPAISNQPAVLFSQHKLAPAISHQPNEQTVYLVLHFNHQPWDPHVIDYPFIYPHPTLLSPTPPPTPAAPAHAGPAAELAARGAVAGRDSGEARRLAAFVGAGARPPPAHPDRAARGAEVVGHSGGGRRR
jgi:hypothetical protein